MRKYKEYAIYKGDKFLYMGTVKECAKHFNVEERTIYFYSTKAHKKRVSGTRKNGKYRNSLIAIVVED